MMLFKDSIQKIIEGLIFMAADPIRPEQLAEITGTDLAVVKDVCAELMETYQANEAGFYLRQIDGGYLFYASPLLNPYLEKLYAPRMRQLSSAAYETLAIVAYQGPVTRSQIEEFRGVRSDGPLNQLLSRGLVEEKGRLDAPGRPILFRIGPQFMKAFGLDRIDELEDYERIQELLVEPPELEDEVDEGAQASSEDAS